MKRRDNLSALGDVIDAFLKESRLTSKLQKVRIEQAWYNIVSKDIAECTTRVFYEDGKLTVILNNSVLRHELKYQKTELIKLINEKLSINELKEILLY